MYGEFEKIGENKYSRTNSDLNFSFNLYFDGEYGERDSFDVKHKLIEDSFDLDFKEYFNIK